ncbi:MAG: hydrogenase expression/formation protein HypE [Candidatus Bathyarchaeia archaeon]
MNVKTKGVIKLEHGGGGRLMRQLIEEIIVPKYRLNRVEGGIGLPEMDDGASIPLNGREIIFTTDAYTVKPPFFPGGDIGRLAVCGTVNDLAMMGAKPIAMATSLILEEGLHVEVLEKIVNSINEALEEVGIPLIAGDTKVVERGSLDGLIVGASGLGIASRVITDYGLKPGDRILISAPIGNHELALLSIREGLNFETPIRSDVAPLWKIVEKALNAGHITAMKDPTRGGVAGALNEMARKSKVDIIIREESIPMREEVREAAEILGLDPLELANEGVAIMGVDAKDANKVLEAIKVDPYGKDAAIVGEVLEGRGRVILETIIGGKRIVREPLGSPLPRIC